VRWKCAWSAKTLVPSDMAQMGVRVCNTLEEGIKKRDADVVIMLRRCRAGAGQRANAEQPGVSKVSLDLKAATGKT
jgi:hypothetical protein